MDFQDICFIQSPITVTLLLGLILLLYIYGSWPMSYWKQRSIHGPKPTPYFGNTLEFRKLGMQHCFIKWNEKYGRVYGVYLLRRPLLVVSDPEMLKEIMVKNFSNFTDKYTMTDRKANHALFSKMMPFARGAEWKRIRTIVAPAFSSNKLKSVEGFINECSERLAKSIVDKAQKKEQLNTKEVFGAFTLDLIAAILFGVGLDSMSNRDSPMFFHAREVLKNTPLVKIVFILSGLFPILQTPMRLLGFTLLPKKNVDFFIESGNRILEERKENGSKAIDFLQLLINAQNNDIKNLTNYEIVAQLAIFFVAGYETTASTLQFLTHSLAKNPSVQDKLIAELDKNLGKEVPTSDNIGCLKYMDAVISETLRLYPPISYLTRETISDCVIKGINIEAGTGIFIPAFAIGHDPQFFPDPESFRPERFLDDESSSVDPMTYLPFGAGPRQCIGMRLATKEIKIALVHILRKVRFTHTNELTWPKDFNPTFLKTEKPVIVTAHPRSSE